MTDGETTVPRRLDELPRARVSDTGPPALPDRYRVEEEAGRGGMAVVYRAVDTMLDRRVAVKVLSYDGDGSERSLGRFRREARLLASLDHPGIVDIWDVGELPDGRPYLVMEWMEGGTLRQHVEREGPLDEHRLRPMALAMAEALAAAHRKGVIHRDIKPQNLLLDRDGAPHLSDFGVARNDMESTTTSTGGVVGTMQYMAPEQLRGAPTAASDVYSWGLSMVFLACGERSPEAARARLSPAFARLLNDCLALEERDRIPDGVELLRRLEALPTRPRLHAWLGRAATTTALLGTAALLFVFAPEPAEPGGVHQRERGESVRPVTSGSQGSADSERPGSPTAAPDEPSVRVETRALEGAGEVVSSPDAKPRPVPSPQARVVHRPPPSVALGAAISIRAELQGAELAGGMVHILRSGGDPGLKPMDVEGNVARVNLPATDKESIRYWLELVDKTGKRHRVGSAAGPVVVPVD